MKYVVLFKTPKNSKWRLATNKIFKTFKAADKFAKGSGSTVATRRQNITTLVKKINL